MITLVLYEDNEKLCKSLQLLFSGIPDIMLIDTFSNCLNAKKEMLEYEPDVVLMDIDMPRVNGIDGVRIIKEVSPDTHVLMHTVFDDDDKIFRSLAAGADGYILKTATPDELYNAIKDLSAGGSPMSPGVAKKVLESFRKNEKPDSEITELSSREKDILQMLTKGYTYKKDICRVQHNDRHNKNTHKEHIHQAACELWYRGSGKGDAAKIVPIKS